jgi:translation initiation factor IF-2
MPHRKHSHEEPGGRDENIEQMELPLGAGGLERQKLELVVKADSVGSAEAAVALLAKLKTPGVEMKVIQSGVGSISKSDLLMALTGSRLVIGFNVGTVPRLEQWAKEHGVEVRLYKVIYELAEDIKNIARSFIVPKAKEKITGKAKIIALFKSSPGGIILGCEVLEGVLAVGRSFRVISAMGPIYTGKIHSLQIEKKSIKEARTGNQAGLKILDFYQARIGDLVECFEGVAPGKTGVWKPSGDILHIETGAKS